MTTPRKRRRQLDRARARRPQGSRHFNLQTRLALVVVGLMAVIGGGAVLAAAGPSTSQRLGRVAGILILAGIIAVVFGLMGRV